jgi:glutamate---cysteine ligase / carboxylate-amine ligase
MPSPLARPRHPITPLQDHARRDEPGDTTDLRHRRSARSAPRPDFQHPASQDRYGSILQRQLVGSLQVHVAVGTAEGTLAVYNTLRSYLPELAALAAAAPFFEGSDTGLASVRPIICAQLPRQGIPPSFATWSEFAEQLRWGTTSGILDDGASWWWELRPHPVHGTLEIRVPDAQASIRSAEAIVTTVHALVRHLTFLHHDGAPMPPDAAWRIAENRWSALRDGVHGTLHDLRTGEPRPTGRRLCDLLDLIEPHSRDGLDAARELVARNGADRLRDIGLAHAVAWLADEYRLDT